MHKYGITNFYSSSFTPFSHHQNISWFLVEYIKSKEVISISHQVPVKHPVGMEIMDAIQDLVEEWLDHVGGGGMRFLASSRRSVIFDDVLQV